MKNTPVKIKREIEYYIKETKFIPELKDTLNLVSISNEDFFIELVNEDYKKRTDNEVYICYISSELVLLDSFLNKILVSNIPSTETPTPYTFLIDLSDDISIISYEKY